MKLVIILLFLTCSLRANSQEVRDDEVSSVIDNLEQNAENQSSQNGDLNEMVLLSKIKINLNKADETTLEQLLFLNSLEITSIINYRNNCGDFVDPYELQGIPGLDVVKAKLLSKYVMISNETYTIDLKKVSRNGEHHFLLSCNQSIQLSKGFKSNTVNTNSHFEGSPQSLLLKYNYKFRNRLDYGFVAEKDAGESFFRESNTKGFDFYSAHLFIKNLKFFKSIAIGDFNVNFGQGLLLWQSFAFEKGSDVLQIKRQGEVLKSYQSTNESNFMRGIGVTIKFRKIECTVFGSSYKKDANVVVDSATGFYNSITSFQISGLHRTPSEIADEKLQRQNAFGTRMLFRNNKVSLGFNLLHHQFSLSKQKDNLPYHLYDFQGKELTNCSVDYSTTIKNIHLYGEVAMSDHFSLAWVNGFLISLSKNMDMAFLYRNISPSYQSFNSNVYSENYETKNEKGFYAGIVIKPFLGWQLNAYLDCFSFPWLKYGVNAPSSGFDYNLQAIYVVNKKTQIQLGYKTKLKLQNGFSDFNRNLMSLQPSQRKDIRFQIEFSLNDKLSFSNRLEIAKYKVNQLNLSDGFLFYTDLKSKNIIKNISAEFRLLLFDVNSYDARIYAYENDLAQSISIPNFNGKGLRYFLILKYKLNRNLGLLAKYSTSIYSDRDQIGESSNLINGNKQSEYKIQFYANW